MSGADAGEEEDTARVFEVSPEEVRLAGQELARELVVEPGLVDFVAPGPTEAVRQARGVAPGRYWVDGVRTRLDVLGVRTDNELVWLLEFAGRLGLGPEDRLVLVYLNRRGRMVELLHHLSEMRARRVLGTARWRMELAADADRLSRELGRPGESAVVAAAGRLGVDAADVVVAVGGIGARSG